jgi:hypothetical protein
MTTAFLDYAGIEDAVVTVLRNDPEIVKAKATILNGADLQFERGPAVVVYLRRRTRAEGQPIAANTRARFELRFSIWCFEMALDFKAARRARDVLIRKVENALMGDPDKFDHAQIEKTWLEGGDFDTALAENDNEPVQCAEVQLVVCALGVQET